MSYEMETEVLQTTDDHGNVLDEKYTFPWMGIVANLPVRLNGGFYVGKSGSWLDTTRFYEITRSKFLGKDADLKAAQLCSVGEHHLRDPNWHPLKDVTRENGFKEMIIDENDERLTRLKHEFGQAAYELVTTALMEMTEGPSTRCVTTELWNYKVGRKATLNEGITYALQMLKASKTKKC